MYASDIRIWERCRTNRCSTPVESNAVEPSLTKGMSTLPPQPWLDFTSQRQHVGRTGDLGLSGNSFSFLCWIVLRDRNVADPGDQGDQTILAQEAIGTGECLHITIRNMKPYFGFYGHDTGSKTELSLHTWYHLGFVYDVNTRTQLIYVNGRLDARSDVSIPPLRGNHDLYYSHYYKGRPLKGLLAAPHLLSGRAASQEEIIQHMNPTAPIVHRPTSPNANDAEEQDTVGLLTTADLAEDNIEDAESEGLYDPVAPSDASPGDVAAEEIAVADHGDESVLYEADNGIETAEFESPVDHQARRPNVVEDSMQELAAFICSHDHRAFFIRGLERDYAAAQSRHDYGAVVALGKAIGVINVAERTLAAQNGVHVTELHSRYGALVVQLTAQCQELALETNFEKLAEVAAQLSMLKALDISVLR
jgi:hypothetical protein